MNKGSRKSSLNLENLGGINAGEATEASLFSGSFARNKVQIDGEACIDLQPILSAQRN